MILVDTSVWVDYLRSGDSHLAQLLNENLVLGHPWVFGEIVLGGLRHNSPVAGLMPKLPQASMAIDAEVLALIRQAGLAGTGIGYVDAQLLTAARLSPDARLWTRDRRVAEQADRLGIGYRPGAKARAR